MIDKKIHTKDELIRVIEDYANTFSREKETCEKAITLLKKHQDERVLFRDYFNDGHFTGSVVVVNPEKNKILLMHHKKYGTWQQFGGHADGEVDIRNVAIRELEEEAGIREEDINLSKDIFLLDIHEVPEIRDEPTHFHYDITYLAIVDDDLEYIKQEAEVHDIEWFVIDEVQKQLGTGKFSSGFEHIFKKIKK